MADLHLSSGAGKTKKQRLQREQQEVANVQLTTPLVPIAMADECPLPKLKQVSLADVLSSSPAGLSIALRSAAKGRTTLATLNKAG